MEINTPLNLNSKELKCFNEIVKPQLEELYSYNYDKFEFKQVKIFISKDRFPDNTKRIDIEEIKDILNNIPETHLRLISEIYLVSFHCKDDNHKEIKGRTLPIIHKILIYPKAYNRLKVVLTHEVGHLVFEKELTKRFKIFFVLALTQTFSTMRFSSLEQYHFFVKEQFADSYEIFINNPKKLQEFSLIYDFFIRHFK